MLIGDILKIYFKKPKPVGLHPLQGIGVMIYTLYLNFSSF